MSDIFEGDKKLGNEEKQESFGNAFSNIGRGLKVLLFKRFHFNLFFVILVIIIASVGTFFLKPDVVLECEEIICPECQEPEICVCEDDGECPELDCSFCPCEQEVYEYRYVCPRGGIVNDTKDCIGNLPELDPQYSSSSKGVSLSLDAVSYYLDNGTLRIKQINYTIINQGSDPIFPKVGVKMYETYTSKVKTAAFLRTFKSDEILDVNDWVIVSESTNIAVLPDKETIRLELIDTTPDPDQDITLVYRELDTH